jgi:hypothetical protein
MDNMVTRINDFWGLNNHIREEILTLDKNCEYCTVTLKREEIKPNHLRLDILFFFVALLLDTISIFLTRHFSHLHNQFYQN